MRRACHPPAAVAGDVKSSGSSSFSRKYTSASCFHPASECERRVQARKSRPKARHIRFGAAGKAVRNNIAWQPQNCNCTGCKSSRLDSVRTGAAPRAIKACAPSEPSLLTNTGLQPCRKFSVVPSHVPPVPARHCATSVFFAHRVDKMVPCQRPLRRKRQIVALISQIQNVRRRRAVQKPSGREDHGGTAVFSGTQPAPRSLQLLPHPSRACNQNAR